MHFPLSNIFRDFQQNARLTTTSWKKQYANTYLVMRGYEVPRTEFSTWVGGSILGRYFLFFIHFPITNSIASISCFVSPWLSREEYDKEGASVVHKKFL